MNNMIKGFTQTLPVLPRNSDNKPVPIKVLAAKLMNAKKYLLFVSLGLGSLFLIFRNSTVWISY